MNEASTVPDVFSRTPVSTGLAIALSCAVPLRIMEYKARGGPADYDRERVREHANLIAEKGDVLQFGGKKGEAGRVFNALADGLAVLAFCPGGVTFAGTHYEAGA